MIGSRFVRKMRLGSWQQPSLARLFSSGPAKYVSKEFGETEYEEMRTSIHIPDAIPSWYFKFDDGKYHVLKTISDNSYLLTQGIVLPRYAGSAYYSLERNGTVFHVFNMERMVSVLSN